MIRRDHFRKYALVCLAASVSILPVTTGFAEENTIAIVPAETVNGNVELTPGYISGMLDLGGQNISKVELQANSNMHAAKLYPTSEGPYTMTVNVPAGESLAYKLSGVAWMDGYNTRMFFKNRSAVVAEGLTSHLDYRVNSGYIAAKIITNGCSLSRTELWAYLNTETDYSHATTKKTTENLVRFPVQPNSDIRVYGQAQLSTGSTVNLESQYVDVMPGQDTTVSWEVDCVSGQLGDIEYNEGATSPYKTVRRDGGVSFDNLAPANYRLYTYSY